jgi:hypothetical protein
MYIEKPLALKITLQLGGGAHAWTSVIPTPGRPGLHGEALPQNDYIIT